MSRATRSPERDGRVRVFVNADGFFDAPTALIEAGVRRALAEAGEAVADISVTLLSDPRIEELNARYLGEDGPTDVLAFSLGEDSVLGDVYVGFERARRQAAEYGVPLGEELVRLAIHGTLHVLGHDHPSGSERASSPMFALQERLVREVWEHG